jgi:anti-anti-sigma regulatory factor
MSNGKILAANSNGLHVLKFVGDVRLNYCTTLENYFDDMFIDPSFKTILIDLSQTQCIDSTSLGQLAKIAILSNEKFNQIPTIISPLTDITRLLLSMGFDKVFNIVKAVDAQIEPIDELQEESDSQQRVQKRVLEAHELLMSMNDRNKETFKDLVETLQQSFPTDTK